MKHLKIFVLAAVVAFGATCQKNTDKPLPSEESKVVEQAQEAESSTLLATTATEEQIEAAPDETSSDEEASEPEPTTPPRQPEDYLDGRIGEAQIFRVYADGFATLTPEKRLLAYRLSRAVFSARPILMDQLYSNNLELTRFFIVLKKNNIDTPTQLDKGFSSLLGQIWLNSGIYDLHTLRKLTPSFTSEQLQAAASALVSTGVELIAADKDESLEQKLSRINQILFDPEYQPVLAYRPGDKSPFFSYPLNLYEGVTASSLANFEEKYPLNSRLVVVDGKVIEDVYRTGDRLRKIPRGRYKKSLQKIINHLERAAVLSSSHLRRSLVELAEFFRNGDAGNFRQACELLSSSQEDVLFSLGFVNTSLDPRRKKGLMEGFVGIRNRGLEVQASSALDRLEEIRSLLDWPTEWKNNEPAQATAAELIAGIGRAGPTSSFSALVCGELQRKGPVVIFTNLLQAYSQTVWDRLVKSRPALFSGKEDLDLFKMAFAWEILYSVLGPQLGASPEGFQEKLFPYDQLALELFRAAAAFWLAGMPEVRQYVAFDFQDLLPRIVLLNWLHGQVLQTKERIHTPQLWAQRIMINFFLEKKLLEIVTSGPEIKINIAPASALAEQSGKLLKRIQRAIYLSDRTALKKMAEKYSAFNHPWASSLTASAQAAGLLPRHGWLLPHLKLVKSEGRAIDAAIDYNETLEQQIMRHLDFSR